MNCFIYLDSKKQRKRLAQNSAGSIPMGIPISYLKTVANSEEAFIYEKRHSTDKSLFSEVASPSFFRNPMDRRLYIIFILCLYTDVGGSIFLLQL